MRKLSRWLVWESNPLLYSPFDLLGVFDTKGEAEDHKRKCQQYAVDNHRGSTWCWEVVAERECVKWGLHTYPRMVTCSPRSEIGRNYLLWRREVGLPPIRERGANRAGWHDEGC